jgi:DNA-binding NtrC family response regulator
MKRGHDELPTQPGVDVVGAVAPPRWVLRGALPGDETEVCVDSRVSIGRGSECGVQIAGVRVSRLHAEIRPRGRLLVVRDLGSTNGTFVDGQRVERQILAPGSVLRLGEWVAVIEQQAADDTPCRFGELAPGIWGGTRLARAVRPLVQTAKSSIPLLLVGRTGTGKERFARALHDLGGKQRPFCAINCAALPDSMAEAELFGYRKGAFTGAEQASLGRMRAANGGTLFLDEIGDLALGLQAKLLRALDSGEVAPIGETREAHFSARVVAACQEPLVDLVAQGRFREDLAARLGGLVITLPELGERRSEIPSLFQHQLRVHSGGVAPPVCPRLFERLCLYDFPANVRELEFVARRMLALHAGEPLLRCEHLPDHFKGQPDAVSAPSKARDSDRNQEDLASLMAALNRARGNVARAAEYAGISRQRAYRLIRSRRLTGVVSLSRAATLRVVGQE